MDLNKALAKSIKEASSYEGLSLEFSKSSIEEIQKYGMIHNISEYIEKDELRTYIHCTKADGNTFLYVIQKMLEDGEVELKFTEKASEKSINYLNKLAKIEEVN